jgi:hypothetical protein
MMKHLAPLMYFIMDIFGFKSADFLIFFSVLEFELSFALARQMLYFLNHAPSFLL